MAGKFVSSVDALADRIADGSSLAISTGSSPDMPMSTACALIAKGVKNLHLITVPTAAFPAVGMLADLMIGAGCISSVETSGISLGEVGPAPRFTQAARAGRLKVIDSTCPAIFAAIQAGAKGQPFTTLRGLIGSDLLTHRTDYAVIPNPFAPHDPVVVFKAINPEFTILHAPYADRSGNVWFGRARCSLDLAHASKQVLITVDRIVEHDLMTDERDAAGTIPAFYVEAIAVCPNGSRPMRLDGSTDVDLVSRYAVAARTDAQFDAFLQDWLASQRDHEASHAIE